MAVRKATVKTSKRIGFIDEIRGFAILAMVLYHLGFDLVMMYNVDIPFFLTPQMSLVRDLFAGLFIFISGSACRLSHNNLKRGVICLAIAMLLTLGTSMFLPESLIVFGILHMYGVSMILFHLIKGLLDKIRFPILGIVLFGLLFALTTHVADGYLSLGSLFHVNLPNALYQNDWLAPLGFSSPTFFSSDYFPLLPWFLLFLAGSYFGVYLKERRLPQFFYNTHAPGLAFVGRHTLLVYLAHQPVIYGVLYLIFEYIV